MLGRLAIFAAALCGVAAQPACVKLPPTSVCAGVLDYDEVLVPDGTCLKLVEASLVSLPQTLAVLESENSPRTDKGSKGDCSRSVASLSCTAAFPRCGDRSLEAPCSSLVAAVDESCTATAKFQLSLLGVNLQAALDASTPDELGCNKPNKTEHEASPAPRCAVIDSSATVCGDILGPGYRYYLPAGMTPEGLDAQLQGIKTALLQAPKQSDCLATMLDYSCSSAYMPCDDDVVNNATSWTLPAYSPLPIPFPQLPCRSLCERFETECAPFLDATRALLDAAQTEQEAAELAAFLPNCTGVGNLIPAVTDCTGTVELSPAMEDFPEGNIMLGVMEGMVLSTQCNVGAGERRRLAGEPPLAPIAEAMVVCPGPFVIPDNPNAETLNGGQCAMPCRSFMYSESEWDLYLIFSVICCFLGTLATTLLFATWVIFPSRWKQTHVRNYLIVLWVQTMFTLSGLFIRLTSEHAAADSCKNNSEAYGTLSDGFAFCHVQAMVVSFSANAAISWWTVQAYEIFIKVMRSAPLTKAQDARKEYIFSLYAWGWPALTVAIAFASDAIGSDDGGNICFITSKYDMNRWMFFYPTAIQLISGAVTMIMSIHKLVKTAGLKNYFRPVMFLSMTWIVMIMININFFSSVANADLYEESFTNYITCWFGSDTSLCPETPDERPNFGFFVATGVLGSLFGVPAFFIYGTMPGTKELWTNFATTGRTTFGRVVSKDDADGALKLSRARAEERRTGDRSIRANPEARKSRAHKSVVRWNDHYVTSTDESCVEMSVIHSGLSGPSSGPSTRNTVHGSAVGSVRSASPLSPASDPDADRPLALAMCACGRRLSIPELSIDSSEENPHMPRCFKCEQEGKGIRQDEQVESASTQLLSSQDDPAPSTEDDDGGEDDDLPPGWRVIDNDGNPFFWSDELQEARWTRWGCDERNISHSGDEPTEQSEEGEIHVDIEAARGQPREDDAAIAPQDVASDPKPALIEGQKRPSL